jgi:hypothetical protein
MQVIRYIYAVSLPGRAFGFGHEHYPAVEVIVPTDRRSPIIFGIG